MGASISRPERLAGSFFVRMDDAPPGADFVDFQPGSVELGADEVHVFAVPLDGDAERFRSVLNQEEKQRADRYRFLDHRRRFAIGHGALRLILASYLRADAAGLGFVAGPRGKPALVGDELQFNLTHSAQMAMIAVSHARVGIDCEKVRRLERLVDIAKRQFSDVEHAALRALPESERLHAFYRCWTRKEAYVKAHGLGLSALDVFDVGLGARAEFLAFRDGEELDSWSLRDISPSSDFVAAVAANRGSVRVRAFRWAEL